MSLQRPGSINVVQWLAGMAMMLATCTVYAHAVLIESTVRDKLLAPQKEVDVVARFNAKIETDLTKVLLRNAKGEERVLETIPGSTRGVVRIKLPALEPGTYLLEYKVLAADGHFTAEVVRFRVAKPH